MIRNNPGAGQCGGRGRMSPSRSESHPRCRSLPATAALLQPDGCWVPDHLSQLPASLHIIPPGVSV